MSQRGFTLLEVLITLIILAIGMLGLANLQSKIHVTEVESYQRAHAVLLLQDMTDRINSNRKTAGGYATGYTLGTKSDLPDLATFTPDCETACKNDNDPAPPNCGALCSIAYTEIENWSQALQGASEQRGGGGNAGGMIDARGCIAQVQAANPAVGVCTPGVYRVTVAWQGLHKTKAPPDGLPCGKDQYGEAADPQRDTLRRAISTEISIGLPRCASP